MVVLCFLVLKLFRQLRLACLLTSMLASTCNALKVALLGLTDGHGGTNGHFIYITSTNIRNLLVHVDSHFTNSKTVNVALSVLVTAGVKKNEVTVS